MSLAAKCYKKFVILKSVMQNGLKWNLPIFYHPLKVKLDFTINILIWEDNLKTIKPLHLG